jgi:hypothetical protein
MNVRYSAKVVPSRAEATGRETSQVHQQSRARHVPAGTSYRRLLAYGATLAAATACLGATTNWNIPQTQTTQAAQPAFGAPSTTIAVHWSPDDGLPSIQELINGYLRGDPTLTREAVSRVPAVRAELRQRHEDHLSTPHG